MSDHERMSISRRAILGSAGALFGWSIIPKTAYAAQARDPRLIVIVLRGALDGLSAVAPIGDPNYLSLREKIALRADGEAAAIPLDGMFALHPAMRNFARLYAQKQALVVHSVATPYRERSHFDGQNVLETGLAGLGKVDSGWLNRLVGALPGGTTVNPRANGGRLLGVGAIAPLIVRGKEPVLGWTTSTGPQVSEDLVARVQDLYSHNDPLLYKSLMSALETDKLVNGSTFGAKSGMRACDNFQMCALAEGAAKIMSSEDGPRIAAIAFEGWDTHANEGGATGILARHLAGLDDAIAIFQKTLGPVWDKTAILVLTEFGRTAHVNGTIGTDHGTGTVALLAGGAVAGGRVVADWPGLSVGSLHEGRDLKATVDLRAVCKGVARELFDVSEATLAAAVFPESGGVSPLRDLIRV